MTGRGGKVRVIGGSLRNSRLDVPDAAGLRPTPERVRETLFNWLMPVLPGMRVLDLCAGTGALGIEALSRGAAAVQFVEPDRRAAEALRDNLQRLKTTGASVAGIEAEAFLQSPSRRFDLVFLDPPYALDLWAGLARRLEQAGWLEAGAWIYVESPRGTLPALPSDWRLHREGQAGAVRFALYRRPADLPLS